MAKVGSGKFKTIPAVPAREERQEEIEKTICDMCGADILPKQQGEYTEVEVSIKEGYWYPDDWDSETEEYDICGKCFKNKIVPFIKMSNPQNIS